MRGMESGPDMLEIAAAQPFRLKRHGHVVALAVVAHIACQLDFRAGHRQRPGLLGDPRRRARPQPADDPRQRRPVERAQPLVHRLDQIAFEVGARRAESAEAARKRRDQD